MKLFRFGLRNAERPGVILSDGRSVDVSQTVRDYDEKFFSSGGLERLQEWLGSNSGTCPDVPAEARIGSCVARPSKIVCVGLNYAQHAAESGVEPPKEPVLFFKSTTSLNGPNDDVTIPRTSVKTDWEVELALVIGKRASYVTEESAMEYVAGYCLHNDYSERSFQLERGGNWSKGKSCDTFAPLGPFLATRDEIADPENLRLWCKVNGEIRQDSRTADLIFKLPRLVSYISDFMTLLPGDVISTGTPQGVGMGMKPPQYLRHGDVVETGVEGLGTGRQRLVDYGKSL